jgi:hypothetical protein
MKPHKLKLYSGLLLSIFLLSGCFISLYDLKNVDNNKDFYKGKEIAYKEDNNYSSNASYEYQSGNKFAFFVEVENLTNTQVVFHPENIYCMQLNADKEPLQTGEPNMLYAIDPEVKIKQTKVELANNENRHSFNIGLNATFGLISVFAHVADDKHNDKLGSVGDDVTNWSINQSNENTFYQSRKDKILSKSEFWEQEVLRKTTLYKNDSTSGLVFVPFNKDAEYIKLVVPISDKKHVYLFRKIEIKQQSN